jgi:hypothetical protein
MMGIQSKHVAEITKKLRGGSQPVTGESKKPDESMRSEANVGQGDRSDSCRYVRSLRLLMPFPERHFSFRT